ncbi:hypothetical protein FNF29_02628 [Cafeteria roenbergensis]|uniref:Peptidase A1 domain-containing protein n=1 Tax=Cafeteria roenbergensis TaxID=33653 RepID=A0A5A8CLU3_CAFRO|nr:hypothetical protein FNF29_02628 [Cafeteria roenbergensis]|eukprot:KAA0154005.1 hypothetical protein FNF29_02628 [Cafeteria roenbergensis]
MDAVPCRYGQAGPCTPDSDREELEMQAAQLPGVWESGNSFASDNSWDSSKTGAPAPCVCDWRSNPYHLRRCNWWHCGPPKKAVSADGIIQFYRNKHNNEHVSDFNAMVKVGGSDMWMILDTSTSTTWVMSVACFTVGCQKVKTYSGSFIPAMPPLPAPIDLLEGGLFQILSMVGINGHTSVNLGGVSVSGAPFQFGVLDLGTLNPMAFNHTGVVGLAYWEENWPWQLIIIDPMLSILDFMRCGSIFYPIPMVPIPTPKDFPLWAMPPSFPSGFMLKFSFFFGDTGGCFFMNKAPAAFQRSGMSRVMLMPMPAIKLLNPSWMFMIQDVRVGSHSLRPCLIPALCRGHFATGQFAVTGPLFPMLAMLEAVAAPLTCEHLELLPQVSFVIMGKRFVLDRQDYTILGWSFDTVQCMTAFTPEFQLIPGMDLWGLGDTFIRAYYLQLDVQPLRSAKLGLADQPYYEKNGCTGSGVGPVAKIKDPKVESSNRRGADASNAGTKERGASGASMFWKRRQNWEDDIRGMAANKQQEAADAGGPKCEPVRGDDGQVRFRTAGGRCLEPWQGQELMRRGLASQEGSSEGLKSASDAAFGSVLVQTAGARPGDASPSHSSRPLDADADFDVGGALASLADDAREPRRSDWEEVRTLRDLPSNLQAGLASITGGLSRLSADQVTAASKDADVSDPALHSDQDRLAALSPEERREAFGLGRDGCAYRHPSVDWETLPSGKRGHGGPQTTTGEPIGCNLHGEPVVLPRLATEVASPAQELELIRNMSAIMRHIEATMNVSSASTIQYWRGESEPLIHALAADTLAEYRSLVERAQREAADHGLASNDMLERIRAFVMRQDTDPRDAEEAVRQAMSRIVKPPKRQSASPNRPPVTSPPKAVHKSDAGLFPFGPTDLAAEEAAAAKETLQAERQLRASARAARLESARHLLHHAGLAAQTLGAKGGHAAWDDVRVAVEPSRRSISLRAYSQGRPASLAQAGGGPVLLQTSASGEDASAPHSGDSGTLERLAVLTALEVVSTAHRQSIESAVTAMLTALESAELDHGSHSEQPEFPWTATYAQPHDSD